MNDMTLEEFRRKLIFRSWHRGTREMDLIMGSFADLYVPNFTWDELKVYEDILQYDDPDLYNWIAGYEKLPEHKNSEVMSLLLAHQFAK